jgi:hypothetical protein
MDFPKFFPHFIANKFWIPVVTPVIFCVVIVK